LAFAGALGGTAISTFTAAGGASFYPINGYTSTDVSAYLVSVGGIEQRPTVDWTISAANGGMIVFATAPPTGVPIVVRAVIAGAGGGGTDIGGRAWSGAATYIQGDLVATAQRETWICIQNGNTGNDPATSPTWWAPLPADAVSLQLRPLAATQPTDGQGIVWDDANTTWKPGSVSVTFGTTAGTAAEGNDSRLSNARTPTAHKSTHATGGTDAIAPSDIGAAPTSRTISAGTGLTGGGDLTADRTLTVAYGTTGTTACVGNDSRLTNARTPTAHASTHASGGSDQITSLALTTGTVSTAPGAATDIVNKAYADAIGSGVNFHDACDYGTIAVLSPAATYNQPGGAGVGVNATLTGTANTVLQVDGTTVSVGQRILVKNQGSTFQNGVYTVTRQGDGSTLPYILTRATDYDTSGSGINEVQAGDFVIVLNSTLANTAWVQQTPAPINFGVSSISFIQFAAANAGVTSFNTSLSGMTPATNSTGAVTLAGTLGVSSGGTGTTTAQAAINSLAGGVTSAQFLRGNGTNVVMSAIQTADVPTLNQNTSGTAAGLSATLAVTSGGTGATTASAARTALGITPANIGAIATDQQSGFATLTGTTLTTSQMLALTGDVTNVAGNPATTVGKIQGKAVATTAPTSGQFLAWNATSSQWEPTTSGISGAAGGDLAGTYPNPTLAAVTTAQSSVGSSTQIPVLSIDAKGRVTALSSVAIGYNIEYLIVGGGGGGAVYYSGGGGAGGLIYGSLAATLSTIYPVVVGAGGAGSTNTTTVGSRASSGANSSVFGFSAIGGGGGGSRLTGASGGSGGGGGNANTAGGSGTSGQGFAGGNGSGTNGISAICAGGGGGATAAGVTAVFNSVKGNGGAGNSLFSVWATATSTGASGAYAGGGGGGTSAGGPITSTSTGGVGGGGAGGYNSGTVAGTAGTANTGGGAGGGGENQGTTGVSGGSGIVILRYLGPARAIGGTTVTVDGYTYHTFTASGNFTT